MSLGLIQDLLSLGAGLPLISLYLPISDGLPFVTLCTMLEDLGYRKDGPCRIGKLTRWYIKRVLFHPREKDGRVKRPRSAPKPGEVTTWEEHLRRVLIQRNCPAHLIEVRVREIVAASKASQKAPTKNQRRK